MAYAKWISILAYGTEDKQNTLHNIHAECHDPAQASARGDLSLERSRHREIELSVTAQVWGPRSDVITSGVLDHLMAISSPSPQP
jgi:hypothetical protein